MIEKRNPNFNAKIKKSWVFLNKLNKSCHSPNP